MLLYKDQSVQRKTIWTRTSTEPDLKARLDQDEHSLSYKVRAMMPAKSTVQSIVLVLVLVGSLVPVEGILTEDQEELIVELHNRYRGVVQPPASAMLPLKWNPNLKLLAEGYAAKCVWNHNPDLEDTGENLFTGTGELDLERALEKWFLERVDYNYYNNSCEDDKMCGHYTQMVWADTHRVGCAVHLCAQMEGLSWTEPSHFLVCNYYPAGNYEQERPYVEGEWCSQCPENLQNCENNLCAPELQPTEAEVIEAQPTEAAPAPASEEDVDLVTESTEILQSITSPVDLDQEPLVPLEDHQDESNESTEDETPDQDTEQPQETVEQEAVVPPPATESVPPEPSDTAAPEPSDTAAPETEIILETGPKTGSEIESVIEEGPEVLQPEQEILKEDPTRGPAGGAGVHTEQEQKISGMAPPTQPPILPPGPRATPRGQKQGPLEKHKRNSASSHTFFLFGYWSLVLVWICL